MKMNGLKRPNFVQGSDRETKRPRLTVESINDLPNWTSMNGDEHDHNHDVSFYEDCDNNFFDQYYCHDAEGDDDDDNDDDDNDAKKDRRGRLASDEEDRRGRLTSDEEDTNDYKHVTEKSDSEFSDACAKEMKMRKQDKKKLSSSSLAEKRRSDEQLFSPRIYPRHIVNRKIQKLHLKRNSDDVSSHRRIWIVKSKKFRTPFTVKREKERLRIMAMHSTVLDKASEKDLRSWIKSLESPRQLKCTRFATAPTFFEGWKSHQRKTISERKKGHSSKKSSGVTVKEEAEGDDKRSPIHKSWAELTDEEKQPHIEKAEEALRLYDKDQLFCKLPSPPQTAFNLYAKHRNQEEKTKISQSKPLNYPELQKQIGKDWKAMEAEEKAIWNEKSRLDHIRCFHERREYNMRIDNVEQEILKELDKQKKTSR